MKVKKYFFKRHKIISESKSGRILTVNEDILVRTHELFQEYFRKKEEAVVFWYGKESMKENQDYVVCAVSPKAKHSFGNYLVSSEEATKMGKEMINKGLVCLAQFHTHPGKNTEHSDYDDEHAISTRNGFLSLIAPEYGKYRPQSIQQIFVHEAWKGEWFILDDVAKTNRIHVIANSIDVREDKS